MHDRQSRLLLTLLEASLWALGNPTQGVPGRVETGCGPTLAGTAYCPGPGSPARILAPGSVKRSPPCSAAEAFSLDAKHISV